MKTGESTRLSVHNSRRSRGGGGASGKLEEGQTEVWLFYKKTGAWRKNARCDGLINVERRGESRERTAHSTGL